MADLQDEIKLRVDASGVESGVNTAKRSLNDLDNAVKNVGKGGDGFKGIGQGAEDAGRKVDAATKNMVNSLQRQIAAAEAGGTATRAYQESIARLRGANMDVLKPYLDRLDEAKRKTDETSQATNKLGTSFSGLGAASGLAAKAVAAIGIGASVSEYFRLADASTNVASRLSLVTASSRELASVQERLFSVAQASRVSYTDLVGTYAQVARSTKELGVSQSSLLGVIQTISQAVTISGGSADSAQAALMQLSQGFAAGALRGEELNSVMEQTPRLAQAIAEGMGVSIGKLREMGQAGELTAERVLGALQKSAASVQDEFSRMTMTVEQASTQAANSVLKLVGAFDRLTGVSSIASGAISTLSKGIDFLSRDIEKMNSQSGLRQAADDVLTLNRRATILNNGLESGFYGPNFKRELDDVNAKLAIAKQRFRELDQQLGGGKDPRDQSGFTPRSTSYANEAARLAKLREDANAFLLKQSGVPTGYIKTMTELIRLKEAGVLTEAQYTAALAKQQGVLLDKTKVVDKNAAAIKKEQSTYDSLIASITAKISENEQELAFSGRLTESDKLRIKLTAELDAGAKTLTASHKATALALLEKLAAQEKEKASVKSAIALYQEQAQIQSELAADYVKQSKAREAMRQAVDASNRSLDDQEDRMRLEVEMIGKTSAARDVALARLEAEIELRKELEAINANTDVDEPTREEARVAARERAARKIALAERKVYVTEWEKTSQLIGDTLADYIMGGGKDAAQYLKRLFATLVLRPVVEWGVNGVMGALGLGGSSGGGLLGTASNASSLYSLFSGGAGNMGALSGAFGGSMSWANAAGSIYANTTGTGISGLLATNGAYGTAGAGSSALGGAGVAAGVLALPLIAGMIAGYLDKGDSFSGAAYATSGGNDPLAQVIAGSLNPNLDTGGLPDRNALMDRLRALGASDSQFYGLNDRTLHRMMLLAEGEMAMDREGGPNMNWGEWGNVNSKLPDFYRGAGYAFPEQLGWWESQDKGSNDSARAWDSFYTDPSITAASRQLAEGILAPIMSISEALGGSDAFKVATGMGYNNKTGQIFGGLQVWQNEESVLNWGKREFDSQGEYLRSTFADAIGAFNEFDLPNWARTQVESAQTALDGLSGDNMGEQAAQIYQQASSEIANTISTISRLISIIPDLGGATQDAVYNIGQALGGLDQFSNLYSGFVQNFYTESERFKYIRDGINQTLAAVDIGVTAETTRDQFRALVEAQDLTTESGQQAFAALMQVAGAFAEITPVSEIAADSLGALEQQIQGIGESIGSDFAAVLTDGLLGNLTGADLGGAMADVVIGGVYNALASNVGQQISDMMIATVVNPLLTAAMTGASVSEAVSQAAIDSMVANAQAAAQALNAVLASPEFQSAIQGIQGAISSISGSMPSTPYYQSYQPVRQVEDYSKAVSDSAKEAARAAEEINRSWTSISDTLVDEVKRIRGELADAGDQSMAYWQSQFAIDTAAARSGDEEAAKRLTDISRSLLDASGREAMSLLELQQTRAWVAQSLQDTAGYAQAIAGGALTSTQKPKTSFVAPVPVMSQAPIVMSADPGLLAEVKELRRVVEEQTRLISAQQLEGLRIERRREALGTATYTVAAP